MTRFFRRVGFHIHLYGLNLSGNTSWGKGNDHTGLDDTGLDTTDWHRANTTNLVNILKRKTERLVGWTGWGVNGVNGLEEGLSGGLASLRCLLVLSKTRSESR